jgi:hypothetical protein
MTNCAFDEILSDSVPLSRNRPDAELDLLEAALYLEDCLGITLRDHEIVAANLGDAEAMKRFALAKLGG